MAWYDGGNGAGVWEGLPLSPTLKNVLHELCTAVNEREMFRASNSATVSSITRSSGTATATTSSAHALTTGDKVYMAGADQTEYNGVVTVTVTGSTTFTYSVSGSPATPATGTLRCRRPLTKFVYDDAGNTKYFPATTDFEDLPLSKIGTGPERSVYTSVTPTSITSSGGVATVTTNSAFVSSLTVGDTIEVSGASQSEYNGTFTVASKPTSTTFTYAISGSPASPATGTITVKRHGQVTRSGSTVTIRLPGHGLKTGDTLTISGATQSEYNGAFTVTDAAQNISVSSITRAGSTATVETSSAHGLSAADVVSVSGCTQPEYNTVAKVATVPTSTTFTYAVSGTPATPATGSPVVSDRNRVQVTILGTPASPATGDIKATANRHAVANATRSGSTATFYCYDHGFSTGDYVETLGSDSAADDWAGYGAITVTDSNTFTMTIAGTPVSPWSAVGYSTIAVTKEGEFRKLMRQIQGAIGGLITASTGAGVIRFVEDSSPYETNYTLANLLGAGSYGSSWLSLQKLARAGLGSVLAQMQDALDLLVVQSQNVGTDISSFDDYVQPGTDPDQEASWDEAVAGPPWSGTPSYEWIGYRFNSRSAFVYSTVLVVSRPVTYSLTFMLGTFIEGFLRFWQTHSGVSQSSFDVTDSDSDVITVDAAIGTSESLIELPKPDEWWSKTKTLTFTTPTPASHPFPALAVGEGSERFLEQDPSIDYVGKLTRKLVPGTHLTYG